MLDITILIDTLISAVIICGIRYFVIPKVQSVAQDNQYILKNLDEKKQEADMVLQHAHDESDLIKQQAERYLQVSYKRAQVIVEKAKIEAKNYTANEVHKFNMFKKIESKSIYNNLSKQHIQHALRIVKKFIPLSHISEKEHKKIIEDMANRISDSHESE